MNDMQNWVAMGHIKGAFGVKGWVKVQPSTEYTDSLLDYSQWRLVQGNDVMMATLLNGHVANGELHVKFEQIQDRDSAALLRGYTIYIPREQFAEPDENEFYWTDLMGMQVYNRDNACLGEVINIMETGAHDVLVVKGEFGEKLIPFVSQFIDDVNELTQTIMVDWGVDY
jgi:hypothetical protein